MTKNFVLLFFIATTQVIGAKILTEDNIKKVDDQVEKLREYMPAGNLLNNHWLAFKDAHTNYASGTHKQLDHLRSLQAALKWVLDDITDQNGAAVEWKKLIEPAGVKKCKGHEEYNSFFFPDSAQDWIDQRTAWANNHGAIVTGGHKSKITSPNGEDRPPSRPLPGFIGMRFYYQHSDDCANCLHYKYSEAKYEHYSTASLLHSINSIMHSIEYKIIDEKIEQQASAAVQKAQSEAEQNEARRILSNLITIDRNFIKNCTFDGIVSLERYLNQRIEALGSVREVINELEYQRLQIIQQLQQLASGQRQGTLLDSGSEVSSATSVSSTSSARANRTAQEELQHAQEKQKKALLRAEKYQIRVQEAKRTLIS